MPKLGDLIRYKEWPHEELHKSGMTGIVLSEPYILNPACSSSQKLPVVDVLWSERRSSSWGGLEITWDFIDEIESISESR